MHPLPLRVDPLSLPLSFREPLPRTPQAGTRSDSIFDAGGGSGLGKRSQLGDARSLSSPPSASAFIRADSAPHQTSLWQWHGKLNDAGDRTGRGVVTWGAGNSGEGECVDGLEHGNWVFRNLRGTRFMGGFVMGKKHGLWTEKLSNGNQAEGGFAEGNKAGHWRMKKLDGTRMETMFQDGKMQYDWRVRVPVQANPSQKCFLLHTSFRTSQLPYNLRSSRLTDSRIHALRRSLRRRINRLPRIPMIPGH